MVSKSYKLVGGWEKTDPDFLEYQENELKPKVKNLNALHKTLSEELVLTTNEKFGTSFVNKSDMLYDLDDLIAFIREKSNENPELFQDDFNYSHIKFTVIPRGTMFYRRQTVPTFNNNSPSAVWIDYSGTMANTPFSFLKDTGELYTQEYLDKVKIHFGDYLLQLRTKKDLLIINFPYYVTSYIEGFIRRICVDTHADVCVDGYTMDLLQFNPNKIFKSLPTLSGFRELCVLDARNIEFVKLVTPPRVIIPPPVIMSRQPSHLLSIKPAAFSNKSRDSSTRSSRSSSNKSRGSSTRSSGSSSKKSRGSSTRSSRSSSKKSRGSSTRSYKSQDGSYKEYINQRRSQRRGSPSPRKSPKSPKSLKTPTSPTIVRGRSRIKKVSMDEL